MPVSSATRDPSLSPSDWPGPVVLLSSEVARTGGLASHVFELAEAMVEAGADVTIAPIPRAEGAAQAPAAGSTGVTPDGLSSEASLAKITELIADLDARVIHVHGSLDQPTLARIRRHAPVIRSVHGLDSCLHGMRYFKPGQECRRPHGPGCFGNSLLRNCGHRRVPMFSPSRYRRTSEDLGSLQQADAVITYSDFVREDLIRNGVPDPTVLRLFVRERPPAAPVAREARRILFAGRVVSEKGLDVLLRALHDIDATLEVHGDGWALDRSRRLCSRLGLAGRVLFAGWSAETEMVDAYERSAVLVVPSLLPEPVGLVGLEAMIHGLPVVASATGGIGEWLQDGVNGYLVKPGDPRALADRLERLLGDPAERLEMGRRGRALAQAEFNVNRHLRGLLSVYRGATRRWRASGV